VPQRKYSRSTLTVRTSGESLLHLKTCTDEETIRNDTEWELDFPFEVTISPRETSKNEGCSLVKIYHIPLSPLVYPNLRANFVPSETSPPEVKHNGCPREPVRFGFDRGNENIPFDPAASPLPNGDEFKTVTQSSGASVDSK